MNFQFKLRKGKKRSTIISELRFGSNIRIRLSTSYVIPTQSVKFWDVKLQLIKIPNDILGADTINKKLNTIRLGVYSEFSDLEINSIMNVRELKEKLGLELLDNFLMKFRIAHNDLLNAVLLCERKDNKYKQQ